MSKKTSLRFIQRKNCKILIHDSVSAKCRLSNFIPLTKTILLDITPDEAPLILGIASSYPEYSFAFHLDKTLRTQLTFAGYYTVYHKKTRSYLEFVQYEFDQSEYFRFFRLVSNKSEGFMLVSEYGPLDYILLIFGDLTTGDRLYFQEQVKACPAVEFSRDILLDSREHRELLLR